MKPKKKVDGPRKERLVPKDRERRDEGKEKERECVWRRGGWMHVVARRGVKVGSGEGIGTLRQPASLGKMARGGRRGSVGEK